MTPKQPLVAAVPDVRRVPLQQLADAANDALERILPTPDTDGVPVAAFNSTL